MLPTLKTPSGRGGPYATISARRISVPRPVHTLWEDSPCSWSQRPGCLRLSCPELREQTPEGRPVPRVPRERASPRRWGVASPRCGPVRVDGSRTRHPKIGHAGLWLIQSLRALEKEDMRGEAFPEQPPPPEGRSSPGARTPPLREFCEPAGRPGVTPHTDSGPRPPDL